MSIPATVAAALAGLLFGLSLIVAIGAQNTYVIRQGIARAHVPTVVTICAVSDVILIAVGVAGLGAVVGHQHGLLLTVRLLGAAFLLGYAALAARRALRPGPGIAGGLAATSSWPAVAAACLAFTWLNPAVYLDTVVLLGSVAATRPDPWWFGGGAAVASIAWFTGLGFGARLLAPVFCQRRAWRAMEVFVAVVMTVTAARVLAGA
ncbi:MAG: LysE family transporter [Actinomycetota bacterium]|nr:LysE family transporter [Actinomycetota bacterium]